MFDVSIVICTFKRHALLKRALSSCVAQEGIQQDSYEVIVVDNSPSDNTAALVADIGSRSDVVVRYVAEAEPNISRARNAGIAAATGRYVAFLDDDEYAVPIWLASLLDTAGKFRAEIVVGPVLPEFESGHPPAWDPDSRYYTRNRALETGAETGIAGAGNALILVEKCLSEPQPFDPRLGRTGGEDTEFFMKAIGLGSRVVWCAEAIAIEYVPGPREEMNYIVGRYFRGTQVYTSILIRRSRWPSLRTLQQMTLGLGKVVAWGIPRLIAELGRSNFSVKFRIEFANGAGKLLWWWPQDRA